jgi:CubicO group peptidase (beta-lactamase class C family)
MRDAIFRPLDMSATSLSASRFTAVPMSRMARDTPKPLPEPQPVTMRSDHGNPAGDAVSTVDDMRKFGEALYGDRLLPLALKLRLFPRRADVWRLGQAGGAPGMNTYFAAMPDLKATVVTLSNYDPPAADLMGSVLANVTAGKACEPLAETDRPSLLRLQPQPTAAPIKK